MQDKTLRVGIIGFGLAGQTFHAPLVRATPGLRVAAVASSSPDKVRAALGDAVTVLADARALATSELVDLVVVASPNATHFALAALALEAGKHVVVDKPFTPTVEEAQRLAAMAGERGLLLSVFHNRRWDSSTRTATALLAAGTLGTIRHAAIHFDRFRPQALPRWKEDAAAGGGTWMDLGPHMLHEALHYFGWPLAIQADLAMLRPGTGADDCIQARLRYADGLRVDVGASMLAAVPRPRVALYGTRGSWVKQHLDTQEATLKSGRLPGPDAAAWGVDPEQGVLSLEENGTVKTTSLATANGAYQEYYRQVRDAILDGAPNPVPPADAIAVMALLEAGRRSHEERREIDFGEHLPARQAG
jgi:predicted dehydrogenase